MTDENISIILGIISVLLGAFAVWQSWRYKNIDNKLNAFQEQMQINIDEKMTVLTMAVRKINQAPNILNLQKDELCVLKNSKYKDCNISEVIAKLIQELPKVLKQTYIDLIIANLNTIEESRAEIAVVSLRYQYKIDELNIIKELNAIFDEYGIFFQMKP